MQQTQDAGRQRLGPEQALALARAASTVLVSRGKKTMRFDMTKDAPDDQTLLEVLLGSTGNLRAPTLRVGKTLLVGFSAATYKESIA